LSARIPDDDEYADETTISIEFTLLSGETISVRDELGEEVTEVALRKYADRLIQDMGTEGVRTFAYWWEGEFYVDAVRMREVAALSVSTVSEDEDEEDWET
jgi:hypothetical protein